MAGSEGYPRLVKPKPGDTGKVDAPAPEQKPAADQVVTPPVVHTIRAPSKLAIKYRELNERINNNPYSQLILIGGLFIVGPILLFLWYLLYGRH